MVYEVFGKTLNLLWQLSYAFGQIFIVVDGQISKKLSSRLVTLTVAARECEREKRGVFSFRSIII